MLYFPCDSLTVINSLSSGHLFCNGMAPFITIIRGFVVYSLSVLFDLNFSLVQTLHSTRLLHSRPFEYQAKIMKIENVLLEYIYIHFPALRWLVVCFTIIIFAHNSIIEITTTRFKITPCHFSAI